MFRTATLSAALALLAGCNCGHGVKSSGPDAGTRSDGGNPGGGLLGILPSTATIDVQNGTVSTVQLQAVLSTATGNTPVSAGWSSNQPQVATVDGNGLVSAQGPLGGTVVITATSNGQTATALVTVVVTQTVFAGADAGSFATPPVTDPQKSPGFLYPFDKTVVPVNLQPLDLQWKPGAGNDLFKVTLKGPGGTLVGYLAPPNPAQPAWQPSAAVWTSFAQANLGQKVTLDLDGTSSSAPGPVYAAPQQTLTFAASRFAGTIYYWTVSPPGQVLRVSAAGTPTPVYTPPVGGPSHTQCMGCHSVSRDGKRLSAQLWEAAAPQAGAVLDVTQNPATPVVAGGGWSWRFSTFDDTGGFIVTSWNGALTLRNAATGAPVPAGSGEGNLGSIGCATGSTCTHPSWSPDGKQLFFAQGKASHFSYDVDFDQADLMAAPWNPATQTFGAATAMAAFNYDGAALANFHPTVSIDGRWVAFNRGPCSRSDGSPNCATSCSTPAGACLPSALMLVPAAGGTPVALQNAAGADARNWFPNFSPFKEGGFHYLAFFSERDYGWVTAGTNRRQVWVTAIDDNPPPGVDPSHPPFWLPGQASATENDKAEWAPLPCVGQGQGCQGDIDCCAGLVCRQPADGGSSVCIPAAQACSYVGGSCLTSADCCSGLVCSGGSCVPPIQ